MLLTHHRQTGLDWTGRTDPNQYATQLLRSWGHKKGYVLDGGGGGGGERGVKE